MFLGLTPTTRGLGTKDVESIISHNSTISTPSLPVTTSSESSPTRGLDTNHVESIPSRSWTTTPSLTITTSRASSGICNCTLSVLLSMHVSKSIYRSNHTKQTNATQIKSGWKTDYLYLLLIIPVITVIAFCGFYCKHKREQMYLKRTKIREASLRNAGVHRATTIPLQMVSERSDPAFESSGSSEPMPGSSEHIYTSVENFLSLPFVIQEDDSGYLRPGGTMTTHF